MTGDEQQARAQRDTDFLWHAGFVCLLVLTISAALGQWRSRASAPEPEPHRPRELADGGYSSSDTCRACHPGHYASWAASYHRSMTAVADASTVYGARAGGRFRQGDLVYTMRRDGAALSLSIEHGATAGATRNPERGGHSPSPRRDTTLLAQDARPLLGAPDGDRERPLSLVTGSHHMQVLWYETGKGRELGQFPFAFLVEDQRWVPRSMIFLRPPLPYTLAEDGRWNTTCIHCHTTRGQPRPDDKAGFDTRTVEHGIACEACHGPGEAHVARFSSPLSRYLGYASDDSPGDIQNPARLDPRRASQICSQCHAMWQFSGTAFDDWSRNGMRYRPGDEAEDHMWLLSPSRADTDKRVAEAVRTAKDYVDGQYWRDGQARVSGREYHGMTDSACFTRGEMSCMSCHRMHQADDDPRPAEEWADDQLGQEMDGDQACVQCHGELAHDLSAHTRHAPESSGSRCYNCHMPYTSYGLLKAIRSHKVDSPSAGETVATGRPNACNLCHLDRSLAWTAAQLRERFGVRGGTELSLGTDADVPLSIVQALRGDAGQRALAAWAFGWPAARAASDSRWAPAFLGVLLDDPYDAVRYIARRSLRRYPDFADFPFDYTEPPTTRAPLARSVAQRAKARDLPARIPLDRAGQLDPIARALLSRRDDRPVRLLE